MTNAEIRILVARSAGDVGRPISHGDKRTLRDLGYMEVNKEMRRNDFLLTDSGKAMLKAYRMSGDPVRGRVEGWIPESGWVSPD